MSTKINLLASIWGAGAFYALCYGVLSRSTHGLLLFGALAPALAVFVWSMIDRAGLERRITRLEARSEIADERRLVAQTDIAGVEHRLEEVEAKVESAENLESPPVIRE